jgi:hypothetical protein
MTVFVMMDYSVTELRPAIRQVIASLEQRPTAMTVLVVRLIPAMRLAMSVKTPLTI